jgi:hypothetical protein
LSLTVSITVFGQPPVFSDQKLSISPCCSYSVYSFKLCIIFPDRSSLLFGLPGRTTVGKKLSQYGRTPDPELDETSESSWATIKRSPIGMEGFSILVAIDPGNLVGGGMDFAGELIICLRMSGTDPVAGCPATRPGLRRSLRGGSSKGNRKRFRDLVGKLAEVQANTTCLYLALVARGGAGLGAANYLIKTHKDLRGPPAVA